jgi:hypothetical protein
MKLVKLFALAPLFVLAACSDSGTGTVSFSVTARRATSPAPSPAFSSGAPAPAPSVTAAGDSTLIVLGSDSIIVRSAQLVLRKVELKRADAVSCDASGACEDFETGSKLITLPLGSTFIMQDVSVTAPAATYNEVEFEVHKPNSTDDAAFIAANPDFAIISIRVTGTYSKAGVRSNFTFTSDVDQSQKASLVPPVTLHDGQILNVTLRVDIATWYLDATKTALVDPASANKGGANESVVANNIQNSFKAFEDDNHDGLEG